MATVRFARSHGYSMAAQPSGHGATGTADGTILLRTRQLGGIEIDTEARVAPVGAGVKVREVQAALVGTGLSPLADSNNGPSVVGYTLGGGLSWFGRRNGLAANHVRTLDVVRPGGPSSAIGAEQLTRLREIKRRRDPRRVIRSNRPVLPSVTEKERASVG